MADLVIKNGLVVTPLTEHLTNIYIQGGKIVALALEPPSKANWQEIDAQGNFVTPGLIDLQVNGDPDCNLWGDPSELDLKKLRQNLVKQGVTSFLPTLITDDLDHLKKNRDFLGKAGIGAKHIADNGGANMLGIHFEGPFLSPQKPGVHPTQFLRPLSKEAVADLVNDNVSLVTLAPELEPDGAAIEFLCGKNIVVALGHSNASFAEAEVAFSHGINLMTHTFNALPPIKHRDPGAVTAALLDDRISCCVISDGLHVDPPAVKLIVKIKGADKVILVSDAAQIGTTGGGLVGSSITLNQAVKNMVAWGASTFADAIRMASYNPARLLKLEKQVGLIAPGAVADLVFWDSNSLAIKKVMKAGSLV